MRKEWRNFEIVTSRGKINPLYFTLTRFKKEPGRIGNVETMFPNRNERERVGFIWHGFKNLKQGYWKVERDGKKHWQGQWKSLDIHTPIFTLNITIHREYHE